VEFDWIWITGVFEIALLTLAYYFIFRFLRGTPSAQVLTGLVLLLMFLFVATKIFHLDVLNWMLKQVSIYIAIAVLILFQPEIRRALAELGKPHMFAATDIRRSVVDQIVQAISFLAERRIGALIAIEREIGTRGIQETGVKLDSRVDSGMLASIFFPHTPLHDGGVLIRNDRIVAVSCLFPLSQSSGLAKTLGTRHRAAMGLTEETDAVAIVVSEETGTISVSFRGRLSQDLDTERLRRFLSKILLKSGPKNAWQRMMKQFDLTPGAIARSERIKQDIIDEE